MRVSRLPLRELFLTSLCAAALTGCPDNGDEDPTATEPPAVGFPHLEVVPDPVVFNDVVIYGDEVDVQDVTLRNAGEDDLFIASIAITSDGDDEDQTSIFTMEGPVGATLAPGESIVVTLSFDPPSSPAENRSWEGVLHINSNDEEQPSRDVALIGVGTRGIDQDGDDVTEEEGDCDDDDPSTFPGGQEYCDGVDNNCDGEVDEGFDEDGDGYTTCAEPEHDCDDTDEDTYPGAPELCDNLDNNCDGDIDEGLADEDGDGSPDCYDNDGDGQSEDDGDCDDQNDDVYDGAPEVCDGLDNDCSGAPDDDPLCTDDDGDGQSEDGGDCDDTDDTVYDDAPELCDLQDNDCDTVVDEGTDVDNDGDGLSACDGDCNDDLADVNPSATEVCNGLDDDCDGEVDEGFDADGDGYSECDGDCNDSDPQINPDGTEVCDSIDNNCDGQVDEGYDVLDGDGTPDCTDDDGDGSSENQGDCNDSAGTVNPNATETCDGVDNDCDGQIDEGVTTTWYTDLDGDGYGGPNSTQACVRPTGTTASGGDCNDTNGQINPGASEKCNGVDDNCNGQIDEGSDVDGDGVSLCEGDCNDASADVKPGATELCNGVDDNCNDQIDEGFDTVDGDGTSDCVDNDGDGQTEVGGDCKDNNPNVYTGATETCDGVDNDCDGQTDEGVKTTYYTDVDADSYGNSNSQIQACSKPTGAATVGGDCNDTNAQINPGATEKCNGVDDNCNGQIDEVTDGDGDGITGCAGDCDDTNPSVKPGATEVCDTVDNDCDGQIDEGVKTTYYVDNDKDTYGSTATVQACSLPSGASTNNTDCNDASAQVHPGATEVCNSIDDDCDGQIDEGVKTTFYTDNDQDGYGTQTTIQACSKPSNGATVAGDCNDANANVNPGKTEVCNSIDDDCDAQIDEGFDADADGYTSCGGDCADNDPKRNPGVAEKCNGIDDDCDGTVDDGFPVVDGQVDCTGSDDDGDGYSEDQYDCSDTDPNVYPITVDASYAGSGSDGSISKPFKTVQAGMDAAQVCPHVWVKPGTYKENPRFPAFELSVRSTGGPSVTTIEGQSNNAVVRIDRTPVGKIALLKGMTLKNGKGEQASDGKTRGGGVYVTSGVTTLDGNVVTAGSVTGRGAGIYVSGGLTVTIQNNEIYSNTSADRGGGLYLTGGTSTVLAATVVDNDVYANTAAFFGGGLYTVNTSGTLRGNVFQQNVATTTNSSLGGGVILFTGTTMTVTENELLANTARQGAGLVIDDCDPAVTANLMDGNIATDQGGGLMIIESDSVVEGNTISDNTATNFGGGVLISDSAPVLRRNFIVRNSTTSTGTTGSGGGIRVRLQAANSNARIENNVIADNSAYRGGGVSFAESTSGQLINNTFTGNSAGQEGGSIFLSECLEPTPGTFSCGTVDVHNNIIAYSRAKGGLYIDGGQLGTITLLYNDFYSNTDGDLRGVASSHPSTGSTFVDPLFTLVSNDVNPFNDTWTLKATSTLLNAGDPAAAYNDPDGSRNQLGAFGGPRAMASSSAPLQP